MKSSCLNFLPNEKLKFLRSGWKAMQGEESATLATLLSESLNIFTCVTTPDDQLDDSFRAFLTVTDNTQTYIQGTLIKTSCLKTGPKEMLTFMRSG